MDVSKLLGMPLVSIEDARKLGDVSEAVLDLTAHRLAGLKGEAGLFGKERFVPAAEIVRFGPDAITVQRQGYPSAIPVALGAPRQSERACSAPRAGPTLVDLSELKRVRVLTEGGKLLGTLADADLDPTSLDIRAYELAQGWLEDLRGRQPHRIARAAVRSSGPGIMIVPDELGELAAGSGEETPERTGRAGGVAGGVDGAGRRRRPEPRGLALRGGNQVDPLASGAGARYWAGTQPSAPSGARTGFQTTPFTSRSGPTATMTVRSGQARTRSAGLGVRRR